MVVLDNPRHEKFASFVASGMSQRKAYRAAFPSAEKWKDTTVDSKASNLAKSDKVLARISELKEQATSKKVLTATERKEFLTRIIESDEEATKNKLKAVDILNKMDGEYVEQVKVNGNINNPFAGLTTDELKKLIGDG